MWHCCPIPATATSPPPCLPTDEIKGGQEEAHKFIDNLEVFSLLANVADGKSLVIHPAATIRLSIGTEHIDDMLADLEKGFAAAAKEA